MTADWSADQHLSNYIYGSSYVILNWQKIIKATRYHGGFVKNELRWQFSFSVYISMAESPLATKMAPCLKLFGRSPWHFCPVATEDKAAQPVTWSDQPVKPAALKYWREAQERFPRASCRAVIWNISAAHQKWHFVVELIFAFLSV